MAKVATFAVAALCGTWNVLAEGYIPEPRPVKSAVEITALYYPGTEHMPEWDMVGQTLPKIKPLLGWYDEGNPEVVDWQIKWAVEHGISSFCVDWYWNRGEQRLDHWVKAFYRAKFRKYLKWYMMYANHNEPGSHSTADQEKLSRWWIDHYFTTDEYYTIDGKPVVVIWDTGKLDRDFIAEAAAKGETLPAGEGARRAFAITERLAKQAGLKGVYWIDMYHGWKYEQPKVDFARGIGCGAQMIYNFDTISYFLSPERRRPTDTRNRFSYDLVAASVPKWWEMTSRDPKFPFWPIIPTGWNDLPRSFQRARVIDGRTPEKFRKVCSDCRAFCEKKGFTRVVIAPVNEWQEGSYIEPNEEFGFGMYDALRDAFCERPAEGWPKNLVPKDVGRGPYDYPPMVRSTTQSWTFDDGTEGWYRQPYGCPNTLCKDGALWFVTTRADNFQIRQRPMPFAAEKFRSFRLRMKVVPNPTFGLEKACTSRMRLKWGTAESPVIRRDLTVDVGHQIATGDVIADGEWHEYALDLSAHDDWKGTVDELWFEAIDTRHAVVWIDWMRFDERPVKRFDVVAVYAVPPVDADKELAIARNAGITRCVFNRREWTSDGTERIEIGTLDANAIEKRLRAVRQRIEADANAPRKVVLDGWRADDDHALRAVAAVFGRSPADEYTYVNPSTKQLFTVPAPSLPNIAYGDHPRQKIDVWIPKTNGGRTPLVVYFHGGGWGAGAMVDHILGLSLRRLLDNGIAVAAVGYRYVSERSGEKPPVMAPLNDCEKAMASMRTCLWNMDWNRIALAGGSAGAATALYLGLKDGNPNGYVALAPIIPQTSLDPQEMRAWIPNSKYGAHAFGYRSFEDWLAHRADCLGDIEKVSAAALARKIDPKRAPHIFIQCTRNPIDGQLPKDATHAGEFGVEFKRICEERGIPCVVNFGGARCFGQAFDELIRFLKESPSPTP